MNLGRVLQAIQELHDRYSRRFQAITAAAAT
jgi:hypothetical protein